MARRQRRALPHRQGVCAHRSNQLPTGPRQPSPTSAPTPDSHALAGRPVRAPQSMQQTWNALQHDGSNHLGLCLIRYVHSGGSRAGLVSSATVSRLERKMKQPQPPGENTRKSNTLRHFMAASSADTQMHAQNSSSSALNADTRIECAGVFRRRQARQQAPEEEANGGGEEAGGGGPDAGADLSVGRAGKTVGGDRALRARPLDRGVADEGTDAQKESIDSDAGLLAWLSCAAARSPHAGRAGVDAVRARWAGFGEVGDCQLRGRGRRAPEGGPHLDRQAAQSELLSLGFGGMLPTHPAIENQKLQLAIVVILNPPRW